jgi:L-arabinose isomerase
MLSAFPKTSFTEMFCPDCEGGTVFLSHMESIITSISAGRPFLTEKQFDFTPAPNPTVAYGTMCGGSAMLLSLAPMGGGRYSIIAVSGEMVGVEGENRLSGWVNGWFRPDIPLGRMLEEYSHAGGIHHAALVYGINAEQALQFAGYGGWDAVII